jgi:hypothetical protein
MIDGDGPGTYTAERRNALRSAVRSVAHHRRELIETLNKEASSLDGAARTCSAVATRITRPGPHPPSTLADYIDRLDEVVTDRQNYFATAVEQTISTRLAFCEYLYGDESWTYPVLYTCTTLREHIENVRLKI